MTDEELEAENARLRGAIERIRMAVWVIGPQPEWHSKVMARHRAEWPVLWEAIDRACEVV